MQKNILRNLNFLIYFLIATAIVTIQSTLFKYFPLNYLQPDFLLILSVYFGFKREALEGGIFIIMASLVLEAHSAAGRFFFLTCYLYAFVISKILSRIIVVPNRASVTFVSMGLTVLWKLGILVLLSTQGRAENGIKHFLIYLIPSIVTQGFATPFLFQLFNTIDLRTFKDEHAEDEYDMNKGF